MKRCAVYEAGLTDYARGLAIQQAARNLVDRKEWDGILILLEHPPVITIGRGGGRENLLADTDSLAAAGIAIVETDRGGNVTCHNPGQLVGYPVLDLTLWQPDVHWFMGMIEEVLIRTLAGFNLAATRREGSRGVWVGQDKIASLGVNVRGWVTSHGFSLNVKNDLDLFGQMRPCGLDGLRVTSLWNQGCRVETTEVIRRLLMEFAELFACLLLPVADLDGETKRQWKPKFMAGEVHEAG
jgi:lipoate-protein ligase B